VRLLATQAADSSGHYRIRQPIDELKRQGVDGIDYVNGLDVEFNDFGGAVNVHLDGDIDIVVLQRPLMYFMPDVINMLHARGIKVVVELDDDFHAAQTANLAFMLNHPRTNAAQNWHHLGNCVRKADLVTVSTPALAQRYGSHGRVVMLRNCVDDDYLEFHSKGDGRTVGWAGSTINHPTDLQATRGGVAMALDDHPDWRFMCVGGAKYVDAVQEGLELKKPPDATPLRPLDLHPLVVSMIDVGIAPLADLAFNHAKSYLKGLEYAALGIPFVASDMPEYRRLQERYGIGVIAKPKARDWRRRLNVIMDSEDRVPYREFARSQVRRYLTISRNAWRWHEVWESLRCPPHGTHSGERAVVR
jgi:glycosyltransferase involved in cell wall biosynthesis